MLDLWQDYADLAHWLVARVALARGKTRVRLVQVGYQVDQAGWVALVFDRRADASSDGAWQSDLGGDTVFPLPHWQEAYEAWEEGRAVRVRLPGGAKRTLGRGETRTEIMTLFGELLRDLLLEAQANRAFASLPGGQTAALAVEEHGGAFGWPVTELDSARVQAELEAQAAALPRAARITFWIDLLDDVAQGEPWDPLRWEPTQAALLAIGPAIAVPLLELACRWADAPEWIDAKQGLESPSSDVVIHALWTVRDLGHTSATVESLLRRFVTESCRAQKNEPLWGCCAWHAADIVRTLFPGYPEPRVDEATNVLLNPGAYKSAGP